MPKLFMGIDVGTKNVKVVVISEEGKVVERISAPIYDLISQPKEGFVERDPGGVWERVKEALRRVENAGKVEGVCVDATSGTFLTLDKDGNPIHPFIMYNDSRAVEEAEELRRVSPSAREFEKYLPINSRLVLPKLMWLKKNLSGFEKASLVLHESDYIVYRMSGSVATSANTAGKSHALLDRPGYLEEAYRDAGIPVEIMPRIMPIGSVVGHVSPEAEKETGIPSGTPIVNGVTDASAGDITSGALEAGQAGVTIGTSLTVHVVVDKLVPDPHKRFYYKLYVNDLYLAGGFTNAGTTAMDSLSRILGKSLDELSAMAAKVPPGSEGLIVCNELYGVRVPKDYPNVRGFMIGLSERNFTPSHLFRSILEASGYTLKLLLSAVEEITGTKMRELRISGGGSRNDIFMQILSDISGLPVMAIEEPDSAVGSALLAAWGAGELNLREIVDKSVSVRKVFRPNPENSKRYQAIIEKYRKIVETLGQIL